MKIAQATEREMKRPADVLEIFYGILSEAGLMKSQQNRFYSIIGRRIRRTSHESKPAAPGVEAKSFTMPVWSLKRCSKRMIYQSDLHRKAIG